MRALSRCALACLALAGLVACDEAPPSRAVGMLRTGLDAVGSGSVVEIDLSHGLGERANGISLLSGPVAPSLAELVQAFERIARDRRTRGVFIRMGGAELSWAQAEELGRLFSSLPAEQNVVCHAHAYSNTTLLFAARGCDRLWLSPAGEVGTVGLAGQMVYIKRLLDRLQIQADFLHMGKYKSFAEMFTEDGPTEAARESLAAVLGSIRGTWLDAIASARPRENVRRDLEHGPWTPEAALDGGLIDAIGYVSEARDEAKKLANVDHVETSFGLNARRSAAEELTQLIQVLAGARRSRSGSDNITVLTTTGGISLEPDGALGGGDGIAAEPLSKTLRRLREDDAVKAVVLRIDSPGGSALASDLIWHDLMLLRDKKPLIASLAGVAASGGYYMACAATRIVAERTTILGSIGVVGGKIAVGAALDQLGVSSVTVAASDEPGAAARATYLSPLSPWDEPTRQAVREQMAGVYELFLRRVAQGRNVPVEDVRQVAEGRIWSGVQGLERRLIDEHGGLSEAIAIARKQAGLDETTEIHIESGGETLFDFLAIDEEEDEPESLQRALARIRALPPSPFAELAEPFRPYAESLTPLLHREKILAAAPFALDVR